jgi:hypothetical protein
MAVTAQKLSESAKNVEELRASQQQLQDAIAQLKTIPTSAKIYNTAQKELSDYQSQLTKIQRRLDKENQAIDSINEAKQQAQDAEEQMRKANEPEDYEAVKEKWDKALVILNDIPSDVFISVTNLKNSYESKKEEVVAIIAKPTPSPEPTPTSTPTPDPTPSPTNYPSSTPTPEPPHKSRREFVCQFNGSDTTIAPNISGSFIHRGYCYIPAEGRECISVYDNTYQPIVDGTEWTKNCGGLVPIVNDPNTGESYYRLNTFNGRFIFSK